MSSRSFRSTRVTGTGASQVILGANPRRQAVILSVTGDGIAAINFGRDLAAVNDGISTHQRGGALILTRELLGDGIMLGINGFSAVNITYTVTEISDGVPV